MISLLPLATRRAIQFRLATALLGPILALLLAGRASLADDIAPAEIKNPSRALDEFMARPEPAYAWREVKRGAGPASTVSLEVVSQTWRGRDWKHRLNIYRPRKSEITGAALVLVMGFPTPFDALFGQLGAEAAGMPCAVLNDVPNQPLDGQIEDGLLADSLQRMFQTNDASQCLIFPMAKAIVKSMDAVQSWSATEPGGVFTKFVLIAPSKRGWAAWLAAAEDKRIRGLVPLSYNNVRAERQIPNQLTQWGEMSEYLRDYTARGLTQQITSPVGAAVMAATDPWIFRERYTMPKLIVDATNNGYWTLDAFDAYGPSLPGTTDLLYVANAGHYMEEAFPRIFGTISAWSHRVVSGPPLPVVGADLGSGPGRRQLLVRGPAPARLWFAFSKSQDFRAATWESRELKGDFKGSLTLPVPPAEAPWGAAFAEWEFLGGKQLLRLTSAPVMWTAK